VPNFLTFLIGFTHQLICLSNKWYFLLITWGAKQQVLKVPIIGPNSLVQTTIRLEFAAMLLQNIPGLFAINKNMENGQSGISRKQLGII